MSNLLQLMKRTKFDDPLEGSGIGPVGAEPDLSDMGVDDSDEAISTDDIQAAPEEEAPDWDSLITPTAPGKAERPVSPVRAKRRSLPQMDKEALAKARSKDKRDSGLAQFNAGLDAIAYRKPFQAKDTTKNADNLFKDFGVQRQSALDERALDKDDAEQKYRMATLAAKAKKDGAPVDRSLIAKAMGLEPQALDKYSDQDLSRATGLHIAAANRTASDERSRLQREQQSRLAGLGRENAREVARIGAGAKEDDKLNRSVADLGKDLAGTASLKRAFDAIDAAIASDPNDIAGQGRWDSIKPDIFDSVDDTAMKQGLTQIIAKVLNKQSGQTVSADEYARTLASYGIKRGGTEQAFKAGYAALKENAIMAAREAEAKQSPAAVKKYGERGGVTSGDIGGVRRERMPGGELSDAPQRKKDKNGVIWERQPDGSAKRVN